MRTGKCTDFGEGTLAGLGQGNRGTEGLKAAWVGGNGGEAGEAASPRNLPVKYEKDRGSSLRVFLLFLRWVEFEHS